MIHPTPHRFPDPHFLPPIQIVAAILAIAGIVMMTYADGFHSHSVIGIALVVGSASMSALYKVRVGNHSPGRPVLGWLIWGCLRDGPSLWGTLNGTSAEKDCHFLCTQGGWRAPKVGPKQWLPTALAVWTFPVSIIHLQQFG